MWRAAEVETDARLGLEHDDQIALLAKRPRLGSPRIGDRIFEENAPRF